jgi:hypothetical protein
MCLQVVGGHSQREASFTVAGLHVHARCQPLTSASGTSTGGDLFFVSACMQEKIGRVFLADVAGHGEPVAATAALMHRWMQRYLNHTDQTTFVSRLNRLFSRGPLTAISAAAAAPFATALALSYYGPTRTLSMVRCGHPPLLLYSARRGTWRAMTEDIEGPAGSIINLPLGIFPETVYQAIELTAEPGDALLLYTDALIEQPDSDPRPTTPNTLSPPQLGVDGLVRQLNALWQAARDQGLDPSVDGAAAQWLLQRLIPPATGPSAAIDDATAMLITIAPKHRPASIPARLRSLASIAKATITWPFTGTPPALPPITEPKASRRGIRF